MNRLTSISLIQIEPAENNNQKLFKIYFRFVGLGLIIISLAKIAGSDREIAILRTYDPIFKILFRELLQIAATVELIVGFVCVLSNRTVFLGFLTLWLAGLIAGYRFLLFAVGYRKPCQCLGSISDALRIPPEQADMLSIFLLTGSIIGSSFVILASTRSNR